MTVNEIVSRLYKVHDGKSLDLAKIKKFLNSNGIKVGNDAAERILGNYTRYIIDRHNKEGEEDAPEAFGAFTQAKRDLDIFISSISKNLSVNEVIELKQRINDLIEKSVLWSKK